MFAFSVPVCLLKHNKMDRLMERKERTKYGEKNRKCGMAALFGMVVDSLGQERSIQYMLPPLA